VAVKTDGLAIPKIFEHLGVNAVVNGRGIYSDLGGSRLSPSVWAAMGDMNQYFVSMADLLDASGKIIARYLGTEAAGGSLHHAHGGGGDDRKRCEPNGTAPSNRRVA